jgi:hypothetical protein
VTRNYELDCSDLEECDHELSEPVVEDDRLVGWTCKCGREVERLDTHMLCQVVRARRRGAR